MKKFNKSDVSEILDKNKSLLAAVGVVVALFIGISIYCKGVLSSLISGWAASFIFSWLFYWFGIKPLIKPQFKESVSLEIVKTCVGYCAANKNYAEEQNKENEIKKSSLKRIFPRTVNFIESYFSYFGSLLEDHNLISTFSDFIQPEVELYFSDGTTTEDKNIVAEVRKEFFKKLNKVVYEELTN